MSLIEHTRRDRMKQLMWEGRPVCLRTDPDLKVSPEEREATIQERAVEWGIRNAATREITRALLDMEARESSAAAFLWDGEDLAQAMMGASRTLVRSVEFPNTEGTKLMNFLCRRVRELPLQAALGAEDAELLKEIPGADVAFGLRPYPGSRFSLSSAQLATVVEALCTTFKKAGIDKFSTENFIPALERVVSMAEASLYENVRVTPAEIAALANGIGEIAETAPETAPISSSLLPLTTALGTRARSKLPSFSCKNLADLMVGLRRLDPFFSDSALFSAVVVHLPRITEGKGPTSEDIVRIKTELSALGRCDGFANEVLNLSIQERKAFVARREQTPPQV